ncbi:hypothetical protein CEUSTIGMA_g6493.t1 [Chlamydomonas eustigma]|uniref:Cytochrome c peroxidase, mitochondrial n=1 Tax=Chlamydomonas eustigma TaxID=1157962 RepID=A0A250X7J5_9CHLO|nr:hypothetical protein CEUSTIGMA_g6493.t1 [Chlamydomonas eustigma]|eukprot:GAX79053.1 hypothetical protein CEUSTIGMA_g6493.t1 [Chlamydomonas eustigma]
MALQIARLVLARCANQQVASSSALVNLEYAMLSRSVSTWGFRNLSSSKPSFCVAASSASPPPPPPNNKAVNTLRFILLGSVAVGGVFAYALFNSEMPQPAALATGQTTVKKDYGAVKKAIEDILDVEGYDDGSYGPLLVRLAWHASGTFDKADGTGGSNGATMRFEPECSWGSNAGLDKARSILEPIKAKFPWISYADLWTLSGVVAVEGMGGPTIPWRPGRVDKPSGVHCPAGGRLPDASKGAQHIREVFSRMGFNDQEMVALSGAHTLGRCHTDRSGYVNPWTNAPTTFSNLYFQDLLNKKWTPKKWDGPLQYEDNTKTLMMLPTDMELIKDKKFRKYVELYAKNEEQFFSDFASAFSRLLELGVQFPAATVAV